ncbi:hypothetical protein QUF54_00050 [Candidatus Marithioploca araucensis]|uniref:Uncharacterized protein n=1 Tax=Candidatus Marithioploca araucensis TaxID=70273 RepID=A0ABT7VPY9_9GAMM|nr:hypothetical protein [Candidatus Marithioploca araucensis]
MESKALALGVFLESKALALGVFSVQRFGRFLDFRTDKTFLTL